MKRAIDKLQRNKHCIVLDLLSVEILKKNNKAQWLINYFLNSPLSDEVQYYYFIPKIKYKNFIHHS
jgi:hypothetical protein